MPEIKVLRPGDPCLIDLPRALEKPIDGTIAVVHIKPGNQITYTVIYWDGFTRYVEDFDSFEIRPVKQSWDFRIGFIKPEKK